MLWLKFNMEKFFWSTQLEFLGFLRCHHSEGHGVGWFVCFCWFCFDIFWALFFPMWLSAPMWSVELQTNKWPCTPFLKGLAASGQPPNLAEIANFQRSEMVIGVVFLNWCIIETQGNLPVVLHVLFWLNNRSLEGFHVKLHCCLVCLSLEQLWSNSAKGFWHFRFYTFKNWDNWNLLLGYHLWWP